MRFPGLARSVWKWSHPTCAFSVNRNRDWTENGSKFTSNETDSSTMSVHLGLNIHSHVCKIIKGSVIAELTFRSLVTMLDIGFMWWTNTIIVYLIAWWLITTDTLTEQNFKTFKRMHDEKLHLNRTHFLSGCNQGIYKNPIIILLAVSVCRVIGVTEYKGGHAPG